MRSGKIFAALAVSLALLTGCGPQHPTTAAVSPPVEAPSLPPQRMVALIPAVPPPFPATARLTVKLDTTAPPEVKPTVATTETHHPPKRHTKPAADTAASEKNPASTLSPSQTTQEATAQPPEMSKLGQLSPPNNSSNAADRQALSGKIDAVENGLNGIKRPFSSDEQKTATLIRSYITRARDALKADDIDGATTLGNKASQLLEELTK
jgi:hypothetical protein